MSVVAPSLKVTVPMGLHVTAGFPATVAVKITVWPMIEGLWFEVTELVVSALAMLSSTVPLALL
jgi:hypothetical protein